MDKYYLYSLNSVELLNHYEVEKDENNNYAIRYRYDFSKAEYSYLEKLIIESMDSFDENALLCQMEKVLRKNGEIWDSYSLLHHIVYVDFTPVFQYFTPNEQPQQSEKKEDLLPKNAPADTKLKFLFDSNAGIEIAFKNGERKTFVPFDKSGSMSRECRITFIDKDIKEKLDRRLLLGLESKFKEIPMILSKFYAYRGLYLSSGYRVEADEKLVLNQETVIVISDDSNVIINKRNKAVQPHKLFGELSKDYQDGLCYWELGEDTKEEFEVEPFDGEGLIAPDYAHLMNEKLGEHGYIGETFKPSEHFENEASCFQIRMPFSKGMLYAVDFNAFISEYCTKDKQVMIEDVFGIERDIRKAHIILTKSMFKCCGWLKEIWEKQKRCICAEDDPMQYFFEQFKAFGHALYVCNTNLIFSSNGRTRFSYQFLNTLDMDAKAFKALTDAHLKQLERSKKVYMTESAAEKSATEDDTPHKQTRTEVFYKALAKNENFIADPKIQGMLSSIRDTTLTDCINGKFCIRGECCFLSNDLLMLLRYVVKKLKNHQIKEKTKKELTPLYRDRFYFPQSALHLSPEKYYAFFRNPHLSRNEQCLLRPFISSEDGVYHQYFSHLKGMVMISRYSMAAIALSGADYDGDLVKVVAEPAIVESVKRGVYTQNGKYLVRKLPIVTIPNTKEMAEAHPDTGSVPYDTIKNTFSNKIGQISNLAIRIGKKEYVEKNAAFQNKCAECTVVTGLEIDAAKTSMHPTRNIKSLQSLYNAHNKDSSKKKDSDYLDAIKFIEALPRYGVKIKQDKNKQLVLSYAKKKLGVVAYALSENVANLERLPYYYVNKRMELEKEATVHKKAEQPIFFDFEQQNAAWKEDLDKEKLKTMRLLIHSYLAIFRKDKKIRQYQNTFKSTKFQGCVLTILALQYDSLDQPLHCGMPVKEALDSAYAELFEIFAQENNRAELALQRLGESGWQFTEPEKRAEKLRQILGVGEEYILPAEIEELLCRFYQGGCKLLFYMLCDCLGESLKNITPEEMEIYAETSKKARVKTPADSTYYDEFYKIYTDAAARKQTQAIWKPQVIEKARNMIQREGIEQEEALQLVYALRSTDKNATFMWEVIPEAVILQHIFAQQKGEKNHAQ